MNVTIIIIIILLLVINLVVVTESRRIGRIITGSSSASKRRRRVAEIKRKEILEKERIADVSFCNQVNPNPNPNLKVESMCYVHMPYSVKPCNICIYIPEPLPSRFQRTCTLIFDIVINIITFIFGALFIGLFLSIIK